MKPAATPPSRHVYTVSQLTKKIKVLLEQSFPMVWISGEISNLRIPTSGHAYFSLKDEKAQISAVMFKGQMRQLKFALDDGMAITALGRISVYEPRGSYQVILEYIEPKGAGALQIAFEQLKRKLADEGLFDESHKQTLPYLPKSIAVITAPSGAVIRDILQVIGRRYPHLAIDIFPVQVQGDGAVEQMVNAIECLNQLKMHDIILLARGGGSFEDLAPFNSETLARSIFDSQIPLVSAIGHETDYTIADFVADLRAPTPSVAAELVVPVKQELTARLLEISNRLAKAMRDTIGQMRKHLEYLNRNLTHPGQKVQDALMHLDFLTLQLQKGMANHIATGQSKLERTELALARENPLHSVEKYNVIIETIEYKILNTFKNYFIKIQKQYQSSTNLLDALNPASILSRGYSITRTLPQRRIIKHASGHLLGKQIEIQLADGFLEAEVQDSYKK